jgi:hypothetical protein
VSTTFVPYMNDVLDVVNLLGEGSGLPVLLTFRAESSPSTCVKQLLHFNLL